MTKAVLEIGAKIPTGVERVEQYKSYPIGDRVVQGILASILRCRPEELSTVALLNNIMPDVEEREGEEVVFYKITQFLPILRGLREISSKKERPWLFGLDLEKTEVSVSFPDGETFKYHEEE
jgi:hypothetical protein